MATREWITKRATQEEGHDVSAGGETALLPTTPLAVATILRTDAERAGAYLGLADNDLAGRYAYLLAVAERKLAEANVEYLRVVGRQAARRMK